VTHGLPVQAAISRDSLLAEGRGNFFERWLTGLDHFPGDDVRIDNRNAKVRKHIGNGRFAAGNAAGQADTQGVVLRFRMDSSNSGRRVRPSITQVEAGFDLLHCAEVEINDLLAV
jgi:hypothetical protein